MRIKEKLRRMREVLQPSVRAGMSAASGKVAYPHERRGTGRQPEMVYISVPGCLREDDVRTTMEAVRDVYRSGRIPVCPCVMFPSDSVFGAVDAQSERKMRLRLMDVCESILICGSRWTEEMCAEVRHAIARGMEMKTDRSVGGYSAAASRLSALRQVS